MELETLPEKDDKGSGSIKPPERVLEFHLITEIFRLIVHLSFFFIIVLGMILTAIWGGIPNQNIIEDTFGNRQICLYFDFRPVPYVLPPIYGMILTFMILLGLTQSIRAWIAYEENKISNKLRLFLQICYLSLTSGGIIFTLCIAVQPEDHETLIVHTLPFSYFCITLVLNQIGFIIFGKAVAWKKEDGSSLVPKWYEISAIVIVVIQSIDTILKVLIQLNGLVDWTGHGIVFHPKIEPSFVIFTTTVDWIWFATAFFMPIAQSLYIVCKGEDNHVLIVNISDNRKASPKELDNITQVSI